MKRIDSKIDTVEAKFDTLVKEVGALKQNLPRTAKKRHQHDLEYVYRMNWVCNKCDVSYKNTKSYHCVLCDYDECSACQGIKGNQSIKGTEEKNQGFIDDQSHHKYFVNDTWSIISHHSKQDGPIKVLRNFNREDFISEKKKDQELYESGVIKYYTENEFDKKLKQKFLSTFSHEFERQPWLLTNIDTDYDKNDEFHHICNLLSSLEMKVD